MTKAAPPPRWFAAEVEAALPAVRGRAWRPLAGGRVNALWRVGDVVAKLHDPHGASPLFPNDAAAEARALLRLAPVGLAPVLRAQGRGWIVAAHVPGRPWSGDPRPVADVLARLHGVRPAPGGFRRLASGSAALRAQGLAMAPDEPPPGGPDVPPVEGAMIHGDAVPGNILVDRGTLVLIDWQCPALGDPVEDLAMFLSPAMQWLYRGAVLAPDAVDAFLRASPPDRAERYRRLAPLFHWRMAAHCAWKARRGASDYEVAMALEMAALRAATA